MEAPPREDGGLDSGGWRTRGWRRLKGGGGDRLVTGGAIGGWRIVTGGDWRVASNTEFPFSFTIWTLACPPAKETVYREIPFRFRGRRIRGPKIGEER
ncbi:unnamed protein product [Linum trigynum]|uniref:Uncharacterized protein n=1 Tax=Linum trigynum TaxID=586398 RepID=A0AAV2EGA4_9ROSI